MNHFDDATNRQFRRVKMEKPKMQATVSEHERGFIFNMVHEDGRRESALLPKVDQESALSKSVANLIARSGDFAGTVEVADSQYLPGARAEHLRASVANVFAKAFQSAQKDAQGEMQKIATARAVAMEVPPASATTASQRARQLVLWDRATLPEKGAMLADPNLPFEGLASLIESGAYKEVPAELQKVATDRWIVEAHIRRAGLAPDFAKVPDMHDPIATGPDMDAARAYAQRSANELNARSQTVAIMADTLRAMVKIVALATDLSGEKAFRLLETGSAA
ncbi:hypothetical protein [Bradyrhizobium sp. NAS96.2]|uniref:hypothetical protein n=1 Tax=Bradyrhizobium sp. NAS96.2 TaxID=1680160 RepID=UPI00093D3EC3|nr:hypothetical protein [Bradyrhizobium sp. NAS96.2]OKO68912.1 hypothetical protein AC628_34675 [Bradyrhizobium sp. NAS96.2]